MLRALGILIIVVVVVLVLWGAIYVRRDQGKISITVDESRVREGQKELKEDARKALDKAGKAIERGGEKLQQRAADRETPPNEELDRRPSSASPASVGR